MRRAPSNGGGSGGDVDDGRDPDRDRREPLDRDDLMGRDARARETRLFAIAVIGLLTAWAIYLGYNGWTLALGLAAIAGIAGYGLGRLRESVAGIS